MIGQHYSPQPVKCGSTYDLIARRGDVNHHKLNHHRFGARFIIERNVQAHNLEKGDRVAHEPCQRKSNWSAVNEEVIGVRSLVKSTSF